MSELPAPVGGPFLAARLRNARRERALTQEDVAQELGIARTSLVAIEKGERRVKPDELIKLSRLYARPLDELLRASPPVEKLALQFRLAFRADVPQELQEHVYALERLVEDYRELERLGGVEVPYRYPPPYRIGSVDVEVTAGGLAASERNRLGLGDGPILGLRDVLETSVGVRVFALQLPSKVAGLFAFEPDAGACVAVNVRHPFERQQLTLAHEYAHFLTTRDRAEVTIHNGYARKPLPERFADAFATEFLLPAAGVVRHFSELQSLRINGVTPGDIVQLAHFYRVAVQAMFLRVEGLRLIPTGTYDDLVATGFKVREAQQVLGIRPEPPDERLLPLRYITLAVEAYVAGAITEGRFARFLRLDRVAARKVATAFAEKGVVGGKAADEPHERRG